MFTKASRNSVEIITNEQDSTMIVFTTQVESVEETLIQFDDEKVEVELIQPVVNRVDVMTALFS